MVAMSNTKTMRDASSVVILRCHRDCTQAPASRIGALAVASGPIAQLPDCQDEALPVLKSFIKARQHHGDLRMSVNAESLLGKMGTSLVCCGRQLSMLLVISTLFSSKIAARKGQKDYKRTTIGLPKVTRGSDGAKGGSGMSLMPVYVMILDTVVNISQPWMIARTVRTVTTISI